MTDEAFEPFDPEVEWDASRPEALADAGLRE